MVVPIGLEPSIDQRHYRIKSGVAHALLLRNKLDELVRALNIQGTGVQCPGGGGGTRETFRGRGVLFERHQVFA